MRLIAAIEPVVRLDTDVIEGEDPPADAAEAGQHLKDFIVTHRHAFQRATLDETVSEEARECAERSQRRLAEA